MCARGSGMRLPGSLFLLVWLGIASGVEAPLHFAVIGPEPGPWPRILSAVGFAGQDSELAGIFVLRPATPASGQWAARVERGAWLILEGESPVAESFGFKGGKERVRARPVPARPDCGLPSQRHPGLRLAGAAPRRREVLERSSGMARENRCAAGRATGLAEAHEPDQSRLLPGRFAKREDADRALQL